MRNAPQEGLTTTYPDTTCEEMWNTIGDSLSYLARSNDGEDWENEDVDEEEHELGKLSEDGEPGWVMGTNSNMVQQHMERIRQNQMKLDELTQPGWGEVAYYFRERDVKYGTTVFWVLAVVQPQTEHDATSSALTT